MKTAHRLILGVIIATCGGGLARGQGLADFSLNWTSIDNGVGAGSGGGFSVTGTSGQPDTGAMSGGSYSITGGFWPGVAGRVGPMPRLRIYISGGNVVLAWPAPSAGFQLQGSPAPVGEAWLEVSQTPSIVNGENHVSLVPTGPKRMFRLFAR